jgi:excisionase family DNA binding protein
VTVVSAGPEALIDAQAERRESDDVVLLRAVEVSRLLGLSRSQVYEMMGDGRLPIIRIGRSIRVPKRALSEWIAANTQAVQKGGDA